MAIKAGQIIHDANGFVIDRIQTGGVNSLNIPQTKIYELGNYQTVATIRDIPDLSFQLQSFDVSTEIEALLVGLDPSTVSTGQSLNFDHSIPLDIISPFKAYGAYNVVKGVAIPGLTLESAAYKFGTKSNAEETFTLRGDSVYYIPGTPKTQSIPLVDNVLTYSLSQTALTYTEAGNTIFVLGACVKNKVDHTYKRLFLGTDFTNTSTTITFLTDFHDAANGGYESATILFGTATAGSYAQTVHETTSVKPAAVRGKDIDVYVQTNAATPTMIRWPGVQSVDVQRRVNLAANEEFGNYHYVSSTYDVADVTGSIVVRPVDDAALFTLIRQVSNITSTTAVIGPYTSTPLPVELRVNNPDTGARIKTIYIPDARFTIPNVQGTVQQKLNVTFNFESDGGSMVVYKGAKP